MLATFAASGGGILYARTCERYRVDPAGFLEDDVLAANLRVAMAVSELAPEPEPESPFVEARRATAEAFGG